MQIVESMTISNRGNGERVDLFRKIEGRIFCQECGKEYEKNKIGKYCPICESDSFLDGRMAEMLAGYLKLDRDGTLKKYYYGRTKKSAIRMNNKRIVLQLLINDKLLYPGDREGEEIIRRCMWRKI